MCAPCGTGGRGGTGILRDPVGFGGIRLEKAGLHGTGAGVLGGMRDFAG